MTNKFTDLIISNLRKIMNDKSLTQAAMSEYAQTTPSQFSKILNGTVGLSLNQLSNIARQLSMREIDIITYPEIYVNKEKVVNEQEQEPVEAILQIKLKKERKEQVLKLVFGDNNIEIFNK